MANRVPFRVSVLAAVLLSGSCGWAQQFRFPPEYNVGVDPLGFAFPNAIAVGDFNGDGKPDVAITHNDGSAVSILLGNGDGTFQPPVNYQTGYGPAALVVGDFNGDGLADLAIACGGVFFGGQDGAVSILFSNGDGTFQPRVDYGLGAQPFAIAAADFNGDGAIDLVVSMGPASDVKTTAVLMNAGSGTFRVLEAFPGGTVLGTGDFNGDGKTDLAVTVIQYVGGEPTVNWVNVLLGNGDGAFQSTVTNYGIPGLAVGATIVDLDGDGRLDVVVSSSSFSATPQPNIVSVFVGHGDGTLGTRVDYPFHSVGGLTTANMTGDGHLDLVMDADGLVILPVGDNGTLGAAERFLAPSGTAVVADVNGDGAQDIVVTDYNGDAVSVLLNNGSGVFPVPAYATGKAPGAVALGDVNGDGKLDMVIANGSLYAFESPDNTVSVLLGNGNGTFQPRVDYPSGNTPFSIAVGDLNGDGKADVVAANYGDNTVSVFLAKASGALAAKVDYPTASSPGSVVIGDFNGDGKPDLAVSAAAVNVVSILLGNGDGTFRPKVDYPTDIGPITLVVGDFNGDGKLDLATANVYFGTVSVLLGNGDGTFAPHVEYGAGGPAWSLAVGDFNGDTKTDIAVVDGGLYCPKPDECTTGSGLGVLLGRGDGTFQPAVMYGTEGGPSDIVVADFNADGKLDLAVANGYFADNSIAKGTTVSIFWGNGDGTFRPYFDFGLIGGTYGLATGDFNGDHKPDVAVVNVANDVVVPLLNTFTVPEFLLTAYAAPEIVVQPIPAGNNGCAAFGYCIAAFNSGTHVTLNSILAPGFTFAGWSGDCSGTGACVLDMTADHTVGTTSTPVTSTFNLNLKIAGNGIGVVQDSPLSGNSCSASCVLSYAGGSIVPLGAVAIPSNTFAGWSTPECAKAVDCYVTMNSDITITATFTLPAGFHELAVTAAGSGSGIITSVPAGIGCGVYGDISGANYGSCEAGFSGGSPVTLTFTPNPGYVLASWSGGGCSGSGNCVLTLSSNETVIANIAPAPDFSLQATDLSPNPVSPGQSATATLSLAGVNGFSGAASLTCGVTPTPQYAPQCVLNPTSIDSNTTVTVTVTTQAPTTTASSASRDAFLFFAVSLPLTGLLLFVQRLPGGGSRKKFASLFCALLILTTMLQTSCGGSSASTRPKGTPGTPPGTYTINITGSSGSLQHNTAVSLIVQ